MYIYTFFIFSLFLNIAKTSALARNFSGLLALVPKTHTYHEHPLHNLDDVAELGVESDGSKADKLNELEEILEDESQSPDEQSVSKYDENVKVFDNPVVLRVTSVPTDDEVKDFEKVKAHEQATEDNHFDSLSSLLKKTGLSKLTDNDLLREEENNNTDNKKKLVLNNLHPENKNANETKHEKEINNINNLTNNLKEPQKNKLEFGENEELEHQTKKNEQKWKENQNQLHLKEPEEENEFVKDDDQTEKKKPFRLSSIFDKFNPLDHKHTFGLDHLHQQNHSLQNPLPTALNPEVLKHVKLPNVTLNAQSKNNFHVFNVHHHHHNKPLEPKFDHHEVNANLSGSYSTKECFEGLFNGDGPGTRCYCSKSQTCKCTKTYMMLVSVCDTMVNDSDLREFCSHDSVKDDHPNLNHRFSKGQDKFVWDAFKNVQGSLCSDKSLQFCENVLKMDKLCQCTKCS